MSGPAEEQLGDLHAPGDVSGGRVIVRGESLTLAHPSYGSRRVEPHTTHGLSADGIAFDKATRAQIAVSPQLGITPMLSSADCQHACDVALAVELALCSTLGPLAVPCIMSAVAIYVACLSNCGMMNDVATQVTGGVDLSLPSEDIHTTIAKIGTNAITNASTALAVRFTPSGISLALAVVANNRQ